jgi:hypothetical protein
MAGLIGQIEAACGADSAAHAQADMAAMDEEAAADYAAERVAGCTTAGPGNGDGGGNGNADKGKGKGKKDKGD